MLFVMAFVATVEATNLQAKRQLDPNFGQSLQSSIEAQNSAIQSSIQTQNAGIQSSISQQGQSLSTSLSNLFQSITVSHSTIPFSQPSNGVCNGSLVNGKCCSGPVVSEYKRSDKMKILDSNPSLSSFLDNVCYSPNANKSGSSGSQSTPAPNSSSSSSSGNSSNNNGATHAHWCVGVLALNLFVVTLFLWS